MWLSIYFPSLLIPPEQNEPLVVYDKQKNTVVQLNAAASQQGISLGMGLGQAYTLCHFLMVINYSIDEEKRVLYRIMSTLYEFNSDICAESSNQLLMRYDRHLYYYGGIKPLFHLIFTQVKQFTSHFHFCTGNTAEQAVLLSRVKYDKFLTKEDVGNVIGQLSINHLLIDTAIKQKLERIGIYSLSQLFKLPTEELANRFDVKLISYLSSLQGYKQTHKVFYQPPEYFTDESELPFEVIDTQRLCSRAETQFNALEKFLRQRNQTASELDFCLIDSEGDRTNIHLRASQAQYLASEWLSILALHLDKLSLSRPIRNIQLQCKSPQALTGINQHFFDSHATHKQLHTLLTRLSIRLDKDNIESGLSSKNDDFLYWFISESTPSFILPKALPLTEKGTVLAGPQRLQTEWWNEPISRDYFLMESDSGRRLWVFRDKNKQWFVQGWFS